MKPENQNNTIRFLMDGELHTIENIEPTTTVLNYLRENMHRTGTKEGCAEGDCGACTVVMVRLNEDQLQARAINACIQFVPTLNGKALFTVESLKKANAGKLHPVQQAMVDCHGSQCGFCTPGFVMSLFALYKNEENPSRNQIDDALAGNLCRCTGYRPIIEAANKMYDYDAAEHNWVTQACGINGPAPGEQVLIEQLRQIQPKERLTVKGKFQYFAPVTVEDLASLVAEYPDATILAGGTDVGLWVTKQHRDLPMVIYIGDVEELDRIDVTDTHIEISAVVSLTDAYEEIVKHYPDIDEMYRRFASPPIRNAGTLVGNVANASPIGDSMPALITLGASIVLRKADRVREMSLDDFYLDYMKMALETGEFVQTVKIPLPKSTSKFRTYKISKRFDQDISAVCGAFCVKLANNKVEDIRVCYGGMAATPKRAAECENTLKGADWSEETISSAMTALEKDYQPMTDMRASSDYRMLVAGNLLKKFYLETSEQGVQTSVWQYARER